MNAEAVWRPLGKVSIAARTEWSPLSESRYCQSVMRSIVGSRFSLELYTKVDKVTEVRGVGFGGHGFSMEVCVGQADCPADASLS